MTKNILTKMGVAERQLNEAIRMFFEERDPVSVYTLTAASHEVLRDLLSGGSHEDFASLIKDSPGIPKENRRHWIRAVNTYQNFFKHAKTDANESIKFDSDVLPVFLFDSVHMLNRLINGWFFEGTIFFTWYMLKFPEHFQDNTPIRGILPPSQRLGLDPNNLETFRVLLYSADMRLAFEIVTSAQSGDPL